MNHFRWWWAGIAALWMGHNAKAQLVRLPLDDYRYPYLWAQWLMEDDSFRFWGARPYYEQEVRADVARAPWQGLLAPWDEPDTLRMGRLPRLGRFFRDGTHFFRRRSEDLTGVINPVLHWSMGTDQNGRFLYRNVRGAQARGILDRRIGFSVELHEVQERLPDYLDSAYYPGGLLGVLTGRGAAKRYDSLNPTYDYSTVQSHISFRVTRHVTAEIGRGRHFWGYGKRSLFLSDVASDYSYVHLRTRVWRFQYHNLYTKLVSGEDLGRSPYYPKYAVFHYLLTRWTSWLETGFFEGMIIRRDSGRGFEWDYVNPLIFYQSVSHDLNSPDNVLIGASFLVRPWKGVRLYHQLILDEWNLYKLRQGRGWWANKIGWQVGAMVRMPFVPVPHYLRLEHNAVRPYTYAHRHRQLTYTHLHQPLAHPLGANFREWIAEVQAFPRPNVQVSVMGVAYRKGLDSAGYSMGGNIFRHYSMILRAREYGNFIGQGIPLDVVHWRVALRWEAWPGWVLEGIGGRRIERRASDAPLRQFYFTVGLRWHTARHDHVW